MQDDRSPDNLEEGVEYNITCMYRSGYDIYGIMTCAHSGCDINLTKVKGTEYMYMYMYITYQVAI